MNSRLILPGLSLVAVTVIILACLIGTTQMPINRFIAAFFRLGAEGDIIVIWEIRLPRVLAAFTVGAALGLSGSALQGLLRNPLAEPGVLGVSACAALGATLTLFYGIAAFSPVITSLAAITGALLATSLLAFAAFRNTTMTTLILIGVGLSSFAGALMALLLNLAPNPFTLSDLISWSLGSVANKSLIDLLIITPFIGIGLTLLMLVARNLSALALGEATASSIGVNLQKTRLFVILGTGLLTGASVSIAGAIGFVGIVAPHLMRPLVGYDPGRALWPSALLGGIILVLADIGVRLIPTPSELRLGVVAALIGAPAFIWIAYRLRANNG